MSDTIISKVRIGGSNKAPKPVLVVTIPANSSIKLGDYVKIIKVED